MANFNQKVIKYFLLKYVFTKNDRKLVTSGYDRISVTLDQYCETFLVLHKSNTNYAKSFR